MTAETVAALINTGAATYPDDNGMLPLHYACAYGAGDEIIQTLVETHPDGLIAMDDKWRTPLLLCLANCDREYAMAAVRFMLGKNKDVVNKYMGDQVPLHALAGRTHHIKDPNGMVNAAKCLELYMNTEPLPTADLISATEYCKNYIASGEKDIEEIKCSADEEHPWCIFWPAFIRTLSMMLGAVDEQQFRAAPLALFF
jgi:hypothetical protein